ncbi:hypothetical protein J3A83DRAFT_4411141 [Scleroderma citrinum]
MLSLLAMPSLPPLSSRSPLPSPVISHSMSLATIASPAPLILTCALSSRPKTILRLAMTKASITYPFGTNTSAPSTLSLLHGPGGLGGSILFSIAIFYRSKRLARSCARSMSQVIHVIDTSGLSCVVCSAQYAHVLVPPLALPACSPSGVTLCVLVSFSGTVIHRPH